MDQTEHEQTCKRMRETINMYKSMAEHFANRIHVRTIWLIQHKISGRNYFKRYFNSEEMARNVIRQVCANLGMSLKTWSIEPIIVE